MTAEVGLQPDPPLVLAIDDEPQIRAIYRRVLRSLSCEVVEARSGEEGLRLFRERRPDLVLLDLIMPGPIDGLELFRRLKDDTVSPAVPVIVVSAVPDRARLTEVDDIISKPVDLDDLRQRVLARLRRRREAEGLVRTAENLRRLEAGRTDLTAALVHDFKNPLLTITACHAFLAQAIENPSPAVKDALADAADGTRTLMEMVLNLLDIAVLEQPTLALRTASWDVVALCRELTRASDRRRQTREQTWLVEADSVVRASVDGPLLRRAIDNLLDNAHRHTPRHGTVRIGVGVTGGRLKITVADSGRGIPAAVAGRIFEKFHTGKGSGRANRGLGLYLCRLVAEAHAGTISVGAAPEGGAAFVLDLPFVPGP